MSNLDIITAAKNGELQTVINCVNYGVSVDTRDKDNATPLYWSCCRGYTKLSAELIKLKPDLNAKVTWGSTALHASCDRGHIACVTLLIQSGADLDIQNKTGNTALHLSAYRGNIDIVKLLVQNGANVFLRNEKRRSAAEEAEAGFHTHTSQFLQRKMKDYENKWRESESRIHSCPEIIRRKINETASESDSCTQRNNNSHRCLSATLTECFTSDSQNNCTKTCSCRESEVKEKSNVQDSDILKGCKVPSAADDRESLVALVEKLQLQIVKIKEEIVQKDKKIKELSVLNEEMTSELGKYKTVCKRLNEQKTALEEKMRAHSPLKNSVDHLYDFLQETSQVNPSCSFTDNYFQVLKQRVRQKWFEPPSEPAIDTPLKEWFPGTDYVVNGDRPTKTETNGFESLTFLIKHLKSGKFCDLKMKLLSDDPSASKFGYYSLQQSALEIQKLNILSNLKHPNILKSLHVFRGTTDRFRKFLSVLVPQPRGSSNSTEIPRQAFFLVTEHYSHTLQSFITTLRGVTPVPLYGLTDEFLLCIVYQILSALCYMKRHGIVHRDLHPGNVYMTERFCPVIGNFDMAACVLDNDNQQVVLQEQCQIMAGNSNAWAPELLQYNSNAPQLISKKVTLMSIYEKSDLYAVGRMLHTLLLPLEIDKKFQQTIEENPCYKSQEIPELPVSVPRGLKILLKNLVYSNPSERLSDQQSKLFIGLLIFAPKTKELRNIDDIRTYCHSCMLSLLGQDTKILSTPNPTFEEIQRVILPELESDFLSTAGDHSYFDMYKRVCSLKCLQ
ncbi:uncharacterized protein LOC133194026 [Saccostrea echinata]|uniref:uncharacterized protein LOC133194026 n=1 Tax=Saccostrea echinata TaxID=191078 RepID=UPI002A815926|nr:uncharacterized protein LOC133194026 [Saccostrea echinata]